jgi:hypothetical protein
MTYAASQIMAECPDVPTFGAAGGCSAGPSAASGGTDGVASPSPSPTTASPGLSLSTEFAALRLTPTRSPRLPQRGPVAVDTRGVLWWAAEVCAIADMYCAELRLKSAVVKDLLAGVSGATHTVYAAAVLMHACVDVPRVKALCDAYSDAKAALG